jgi:hypothetical protein
MSKPKSPNDPPKPRQGSPDGGGKTPKAPVRQGGADGGAKKK